MNERALVICVSVSHGNTAKVARAMAEVLGAEVRAPEDVDPATLADYDVVGFGSGIYYMSHHARLGELVESLPPVTGEHRAFVFCTSGQGAEQHQPWQRSLSTILREKGYDVVGSFACPGYDTWLPLKLLGGMGKGRPSSLDLARARRFARRVAEHIPVG